MNLDTAARFDRRAEFYTRFRPGYPPGVMALLRDRLGLTPDSVVADVGAGTGVATGLFLDNGNRVFAVEPNDEMRAAAEGRFAGRDRHMSRAGTAEATGLADRSVDFVVAAQAFHWFDRPRARREFARILCPGGWVVLLWNRRLTDATPFLREYEGLLVECANDYVDVDRRHVMDDTEWRDFFGDGDYETVSFDNEQVFDWEGVVGRTLSCSFCPLPGAPNHERLMGRLREAFARHHENGSIRFLYRTDMTFGRLESSRES